MPRSLMQALSLNGAGAVVAVTGQVTNAVAGTRSTHAHGLTDHLGAGTAPSFAIAVPTAADADGVLAAPNTGSITVVAMTATTVTVRSTVASQPFSLLVA
ncbi:MAG TPA: hypothetical protein VNM48_20025 [Chloroflexota bacterium]|nr:hypothetical protein [Chloroflexota bacterium]